MSGRRLACAGRTLRRRTAGNKGSRPSVRTKPRRRDRACASRSRGRPSTASAKADAPERRRKPLLQKAPVDRRGELGQGMAHVDDLIEPSPKQPPQCQSLRGSSRATSSAVQARGLCFRAHSLPGRDKAQAGVDYPSLFVIEAALVKLLTTPLQQIPWSELLTAMSLQLKITMRARFLCGRPAHRSAFSL